LQHIESLAPDFGSFITLQTQLNEIKQIKDNVKIFIQKILFHVHFARDKLVLN